MFNGTKFHGHGRAETRATFFEAPFARASNFDDRDGFLFLSVRLRGEKNTNRYERLGYPYRSGRVNHWLKIKNPLAPAVKREAEEDWGAKRSARERRI